MCRAFNVQGLDTDLLLPRDPPDFDLLVEASVRPRPRTISPRYRPARFDRVAGDVQRPDGPRSGLRPDLFVRPADADRGDPQPDRMDEVQFTPAAEELLTRLMQMTRQRRRDGRAPRIELSRDALSRGVHDRGERSSQRTFL